MRPNILCKYIHTPKSHTNTHTHTNRYRSNTQTLTNAHTHTSKITHIVALKKISKHASLSLSLPLSTSIYLSIYLSPALAQRLSKGKKKLYASIVIVDLFKNFKWPNRMYLVCKE